MYNHLRFIKPGSLHFQGSTVVVPPGMPGEPVAPGLDGIPNGSEGLPGQVLLE